MKEQAIIIILLALCAGFESIFDVTWKKELIKMMKSDLN
jgi:hypothetical protein